MRRAIFAIPNIVWLILILAVTGLALAGNHFDQDFTDRDAGFSISLAGDWRPSSHNDAVGRKKTEFVYRDRAQGLLRVERQSLGRLSPVTFTDNDVRDVVFCQPGSFLAERQEFTGGWLTGIRVSIYYNQDIHGTMLVTYYLPGADEIWILRFEGRAESLESMRRALDKMARSFRPIGWLP